MSGGKLEGGVQGTYNYRSTNFTVTPWPSLFTFKPSLTYWMWLYLKDIERNSPVK